ncbi:LytR/AlgR family response regulator transcription factor [Actinomadura macra]|uniref:LytR/AlgR family response regulator transcription factor n=1 Tax=Actinomadura macra TaxID=46164 RepID=UPI000A0186E1|nr:LytTR family DNA-binding domain-containing protein [Actinomadura macra]
MTGSVRGAWGVVPPQEHRSSRGAWGPVLPQEHGQEVQEPDEGLHVLVVDDELPAIEDLAYLLAADHRVRRVSTASTGAAALRALEDSAVAALFLDIRMPGLSGLDLARVLAHFERPPKIVFVTAYETHAVEAFELGAVDYLLKPVGQERLAEAVRRVVEAVTGRPGPAVTTDDETIPVELVGVTRFVRRSEVRYAEAHGDYARRHTRQESYLVRTSLTALEDAWSDAGFIRVHRSHLVALAYIDEMYVESGRCAIRVGDMRLPVSRRNTRALRDRLVRSARPGASRL